MSETEQDRRLIFISYTTADRERVSQYYTSLRSSSYRIWMDKHDIQAGQNWDFEITKAMDQASIIVAFVSRNSVDRRGYIQKELKIALEKYREKLVEDIFLIPVVLDDIEIPVQLKQLHVIFDNDENCLEKLKSSIATQLAQLGQAVAEIQESHGLSWNYLRYKDAWEGLPGYEASYQLIRISSEDSRVEEISHIIRGHLSQELMKQREVMFQQQGEHMNFGQTKFWRTNTYDATCAGVSVVQNVISIEYAVYTFFAGAAHGYTDYQSFVFIITPTVYLKRLQDLFKDDLDTALVVLQRETRAQLMGLELGSTEDSFKLNESWVNDGTSKWEDFAAFSFKDDGLAVTFPPYQVAAFAFGPQRITVKWSAIRALMKNYVLAALGKEYPGFAEKDENEP